MSGLLAIMVHDPDVVFTDLALAILAAFLARRLWALPRGKGFQRAGALLLVALASAALWGAIFHAFFPGGTGSLAGQAAWTPVVLSIVLAGAVMLELALAFLLPALPSRFRRWVVLAYAATFAVVAVLLDHSFTSIVYFYLPALVLLLIATGYQAIRAGEAGWILTAGGLLLSAAAAVLQQARVALHPVYFDHNAVYHLVQAVAVVVLYLGLRRVSRPSLAPGSG